MSPMEIDGNLLKLIITNGSIKLKKHSQEINDLNVFPVPDGDTGSNMQSTMMSGVNAIKTLEDEPVEKVGKALSRGLLMGARGNSGVILSQLFSGFAKAFQTLVTANAVQFIEGLLQGVKQAYNAVINPVEGTILTVAREAAEKAKEEAGTQTDVLDILKVYLEEAQKSLERTPNLLPVLKESGVVDSGGAGLVYIIEGMIEALEGEVYDLEKESRKKDKKAKPQYEQEDTEFGYCTEFIIQLNPDKNFNKEKLTKQLSRLGDSIVVVDDDEICKVHVHTEKPGDALNVAQSYGEFANLKIENMSMQHTETLLHSPENEGEHDCGHDHSQASSFVSSTPKKYGIITVVSGSGLKATFKEMGVDYIIDGGQTMNPSTQDFIDAIEKVNADNILIIPNNKNVMLSAEHAAQAVQDENVIVLPAKTVPQGYASLTMFDSNQALEDTVDEMKELIGHVKTGEITYAIRDTQVNGMTIKKDDYIGLAEGDIVTTHNNRFETAKALIGKIIDEDSEIITIMFGTSVDREEADKLADYIGETYSEVEVDIISGKQEIYAYFFAVE